MFQQNKIKYFCLFAQHAEMSIRPWEAFKKAYVLHNWWIGFYLQSNRWKMNDWDGESWNGGWMIKEAFHSHFKILTRALSQWPITHQHQHIPNPEHIHRCRWAHSGWHQPRRLHTPRPGQREQRTASILWFNPALKKYIQWNERTEVEEGAYWLCRFPWAQIL